ncbi:Uncharacterised protein [Vibrio cholerae]|nr:Uncharacterised protein [Vibrio cholerae]
MRVITSLPVFPSNTLISIANWRLMMSSCSVFCSMVAVKSVIMPPMMYCAPASCAIILIRSGALGSISYWVVPTETKLRDSCSKRRLITCAKSSPT